MISRRKFLGAAAAAPLAAPIAAKSVAADAGLFIPPPPSGGGSLANKIGSTNSSRSLAESIRSEIKRCRQQRDEAASDCWVQVHQIDAFAVDALRSVSGVNKARMLAEKRLEREIADRRRYFDRRIAELVKDLSGIGFLEDIL